MPRPRRRVHGRLRKVLPAYLLVAPAILASTIFLYIPMVFSGYWSFTKYNGFAKPVWVGVENYTSLLQDDRFLKALLNTTIFVILGMGIGPVLGLLSALLLNRSVRLRSFFRTAFFLPVMTSLVVVATIWKVLLNERGLVNQFFGLLHLPQESWLGNPATALPSVVVASIWQGFGFETVVFLAALQSIPRDLYDAALVDGATTWQKFRYVTLPALRPTIMFVYIIGIIGSFQAFDQIYVMTNGGPINSTRTLVFDLYDRFATLKLGEASAVAYILLVILATLSFIQMRVFEERS